jgi:hypothetical protein
MQNPDETAPRPDIGGPFREPDADAPGMSDTQDIVFTSEIPVPGTGRSGPSPLIVLLALAPLAGLGLLSGLVVAFVLVMTGTEKTDPSYTIEFPDPPDEELAIRVHPEPGGKEKAPSGPLPAERPSGGERQDPSDGRTEPPDDGEPAPPHREPAKESEPTDGPPEEGEGQEGPKEGEGKPGDDASASPKKTPEDPDRKRAGMKPPGRTDVDRALETDWFLRRRTWQMAGFLKYVESFLQRFGKAYGWGAVRFDFDPETQSESLADVSIELKGVPLLRAVEQICRQRDLKYVVQRGTDTVRFTRSESGKSPGPAPTRKKIIPVEPCWKTAPRKCTTEEAAKIENLHKRIRFELRKEGVSVLKDVLVRSLSRIRTGKTLEILKALVGNLREETAYARSLLEGIARVDGADAARILIDCLGKHRPALSLRYYRSAFGSLRTRGAAEVLADAGLRHRKKSVRIEAASALGNLGWGEALGPLARAAKTSCDETRAEAARAIARIVHPESIPLLVEILRKTDSLPALAALAELEAADADTPLVREAARAVLSKGSNPVLKITALRILGKVRDADSLESILPLLKSRDWRLRSSAARALSEIRHEGAVGPLIDRLGREKGRLAYEICHALHLLTGTDFGLDAGIWKKWWDEYKGTFLPPPILNPKRASHLTSAPATYHNIPVVSHRIIFLLDISGSMRNTVGLATLPKGAPEGGTRLDFCRWEMIRTLGKLSQKVSFNIITFETRIHIWSDTVVPATPRNRHAAKVFLARQNPTGSTNLFDALKAAFRDPRADTLYVLSDGYPSGDSTEILRWIREKNRSRMLDIHTISLGSVGRFMKQLAEENGGKAVALK